MKNWKFAGICIAAGLATSVTGFAQPEETHFNLFANPKFIACLGVPGGPAPTATVTVVSNAKMTYQSHISSENSMGSGKFTRDAVYRSWLQPSVRRRQSAQNCNMHLFKAEGRSNQW